MRTSIRVAAVIGDVVGSRHAPNRQALQNDLRRALEKANERIKPLQKLTITLGDEFQGAYESLPAAFDAALRVRLQFAHRGDIRFGIGWGTILVRETGREPYQQDGPAWWNARAALERVARQANRKGWPSGWLTGFASDERHLTNTLNAFLLCRDAVLAAMSPDDLRATLGLLDAKKQVQLARQLKVSQSAVSQRLQRSGAYAILRSHQELAEMRQWSS